MHGTLYLRQTLVLRRLFYQENSRRLWRSQRRKSSSVPEGGADFPAAVFSLPENAQTLAGIAFCAAGKSGNNFPAASKFAGKLFQQRLSDSHCDSLLDFSDSIREEVPQSEICHEILILHSRKFLRKMSRDKFWALSSCIS